MILMYFKISGRTSPPILSQKSTEKSLLAGTCRLCDGLMWFLMIDGEALKYQFPVASPAPYSIIMSAVHHQIIGAGQLVITTGMCQRSMCRELCAHVWGKSNMSDWLHRITTTVRHKRIALKTRWWPLSRCHVTDNRNVFIFTFVLLRGEISFYLLAIFGTSVFEPNLDEIHQEKNGC